MSVARKLRISSLSANTSSALMRGFCGEKRLSWKSGSSGAEAGGVAHPARTADNNKTKNFHMRASFAYHATG
jgi:hypothetical protein